MLDGNDTKLGFLEKDKQVDNFHTKSRSFKVGESSKLLSKDDSKAEKISLFKRSQIGVQIEKV